MELTQTKPQLTPKILDKQNGATLFTSLVFLIMLSVLGVNAAQLSTLQERMSGNLRNRDLAFQAAESAVKHVENNLNTGQNIRALSFAGGVAGLRTYNSCLPNAADYWNGSGAPDCAGTSQSLTWSSATARTPSHTLTLSQDSTVNATLQPMYIVDKFPDVGTTERYRVTARGFGGDTTSVVILQAMLTYQP